MTTSFTRGENPLRADKLNEALDERVLRAGDTMQGRLILAGDPVAPLEAATQQYVNRYITGGTLPGGPYLPLSGGNMAGDLVLNRDPVLGQGAATKQYVLNTVQTITAGGPWLPLGGGSLTGPLLLYSDPSRSNEAATKNYVDTHPGAGRGGGGGIPEAPTDGQVYGRQGSTTSWVAVSTTGVGAPSPINTALPTISGSPTVGSVLTCTQGSWANAPTSYAFQWEKNGAPIGGATSTTYTVQSTDTSYTITCVITANNSGGYNTAISNAVTIAGAPSISVAPTITGTGTIKATLLVNSNGTWLGAPTSFTYQWQSAGTDIPGATAASYQPGYVDGGKAITCNVTAHNAFGATTAASNSIAVAAAFSFPPGAVGIYSTRLAVAGYGLTGKCVTVQRFSDGATQDIGFDAFGGIDMATVTAFTAGSMLVVTTWYDQSGSGNNVTSTTVNQQPQLVSCNGQIYLAFNLGGDFTNLSSAAPIALTGDQTIGGVFQVNGPSAGAFPICCFDGTNGWALEFNGSSHGSAGYFSAGGGALNDGSNLLAGSIHRVGATRTAGAVSLMVDGAVTRTGSGSNTAATEVMRIGSRSASSSWLDGLVGEIYLYPSAQNLTAIQASQATYFPPTGYQSYYNGTHALNFVNNSILNFPTVLTYEYTQAWTMMAAVHTCSTLGGGGEAALWSNIYHAPPYTGYGVFIVLNVSAPFAPGVVNCRMVHDLTLPTNVSCAAYGSTNVCDGKLHLITVTYDGSGHAGGFQVYIDGVADTMVQVYDTLAGNTIISGTPSLQIMTVGCQPNDNQNSLKGRMEFLQIDNVVRNQAYISANFSAAHPGPPPNAGAATALRLLMNEGSGTTVHDTSSNAFVGTMSVYSGSPWVP
jgi:hypothetical protein